MSTSRIRRRSNGIGVQSDTGEDGNFISLKDILISNVKLPVSIREAIERKLQENQAGGGI